MKSTVFTNFWVHNMVLTTCTLLYKDFILLILTITMEGRFSFPFYR